MKPTDLRVALFSGNYNYVRDGANQALNLLMQHVLDLGGKVRVYSPTTKTPAFAPVGDLVSVPALPMPGGRDEYRFATPGMPAKIRKDLEAFAPNVVHCSAPEFLGHAAVKWAEKNDVPAVASVHTRFETYPQYYGIGFLEPTLIRALTRFYNRFDAVMTTGPMMSALLREWGVHAPMSIWSRGVYHQKFNPGMRSLEWRRSLGIADDEVAIGFLGRLVLEKGLGVFADVVARLEARGVKHRVLVIGKGPARDWFAERVPGAVFTGFQSGEALSRAVASMDVFFNPSVTESFGNVTLEAMASGVSVVAAYATGPVGLVEDGVNGILVQPDSMDGYADALQRFAEDHAFRRAAGEAGARIAQRYRWDLINQAAVDTYFEAAARHGK
ncbi:glycosyltransferase family 1 protein [Sphingomonas sp.]|uniref:glycosyltransferase family 4 protein n=1 Tax=Sphingomonas sp. TaxID=28214 RepID=UPI001B040283|nr:glycosyltransferase family 1 protein [Sphingomonas sp.]MBO9711584.1 glycosyltransferase family 1 protein [Sphingomonas sp.]